MATDMVRRMFSHGWDISYHDHNSDDEVRSDIYWDISYYDNDSDDEIYAQILVTISRTMTRRTEMMTCVEIYLTLPTENAYRILMHLDATGRHSNAEKPRSK
jgi:hypothetical protein